MISSQESFVDIHTHILHGVDDGAGDLAQAIVLLQKAQAQGTGAVILTPHYRGSFRGNVAEKLRPAFEELQQEAAVHCPGMELYLGCEMGYELDISEKLADGTILTLNGTQYVLLEFRDRAFRSRIIGGTLEVINFGYVPILAHVERYEAFRQYPELAQELIHLGALLQINADSVLGKRGYQVKRYCHRLLKKHCVHFIATDAHDTKYRPPALKECYKRIRRKYSEAQAQALFYKNARVVITGGEEIEC